MILTYHVAVDCQVLLAEAEIAEADGGWTETTRLEISASPTCAWVSVPLPTGVTLGDLRAQVRFGAGGRRTVDDGRWRLEPPAIDGSSAALLVTPELERGDRLILTVSRALPPGAWRWAPGPAAYASLARPDAPFTFATEVDAAWDVDVPGDPQVVPAAIPLPAGDVRIERHLTLVVPPGDPQLVLYPGGGSSVRIAEYLVFSPADEVRGWPIGAPPGTDVRIVTSPAGADVAEKYGVLSIAPSPTPTKVRVEWTEPDAPTFGERDPRWDRLSVEVDDGLVKWEGDQWLLVQVRGQAVIPARSALQKALDTRWRTLAIPEPGAPNELRGLTAGWPAAEAIRETLRARAGIPAWSSDPLLPRPLHRALRSRSLTQVEAGLVTWLWARQLRFDADWFLVRPASRGPASPTVPAGYDTVLVRFRVGDEERWMDPSCAVCAPFEIPSDLEGGSVLGADEAAPPPPSVGTSRVEIAPDQIRWTLAGPPALELRTWLHGIAAAERAQALAHRLGGSALVSLTGSEIAGAPIEVVVERGSGLPLDPLAAAPSPGPVWWPWIGERIVRWAGRTAPPLNLERGDLRYVRVQDGDVLEERLEVRARLVDAAAMSEIDQIRLNRPELVPVPP